LGEIEEVPSELGEPDCKIIRPFIIKDLEISGLGFTLESWLCDHTNQNEFMIHSDKILTICDPNQNLIEKYSKMNEK
jgi:hypothetical protein